MASDESVYSRECGKHRVVTRHTPREDSRKRDRADRSKEEEKEHKRRQTNGWCREGEKMVNKSSGFDGIYPIMLQKGIKFLSPYLIIIFKLSLKAGKLANCC